MVKGQTTDIPCSSFQNTFSIFFIQKTLSDPKIHLFLAYYITHFLENRHKLKVKQLSSQWDIIFYQVFLRLLKKLCYKSGKKRIIFWGVEFILKNMFTFKMKS